MHFSLHISYHYHQQTFKSKEAETISVSSLWYSRGLALGLALRETFFGGRGEVICKVLGVGVGQGI